MPRILNPSFLNSHAILWLRTAFVFIVFFSLYIVNLACYNQYIILLSYCKVNYCSYSLYTSSNFSLYGIIYFGLPSLHPANDNSLIFTCLLFMFSNNCDWVANNCFYFFQCHLFRRFFPIRFITWRSKFIKESIY